MIVTSQKERPLCQSCHTNLARKGKKTRLGFQGYEKECSTCHKIKYNKKESNGRRVGYRKYKEGVCSKCGFIPEHKCQLDVDHIDGNRHNGAEGNLRTLCANCHRLVTHLSGQCEESRPPGR